MPMRLFLNLVASGLCILPQLAGAQVAKGSSVPAPAPPIFWQTAGSMTLPFEYFRQHIFITVTLNGKPGYSFMIDSGANRDVLNLGTARRLGMPLEKLGQSSDIGFGNGRIYVGPAVNVDAEIQSAPVADSMVVLDLNRFEQHFHHPTDGIFGSPFFRRFAVKVDFQNKLITLYPPEKFRYRGMGVSVRLRPSKNFIEMPVNIFSNRYVSHEVYVVVDTGSNATLILYESFVHALGLKYSYMHAEAGQAYGLNGYYPIKMSTINALQLGNAETRNLFVEYLEDEQEVGPERNIPGSVGDGILQSFRAVIFDVPHRRIYMELAPPQWIPGLERSETFAP